MDRIVHVCNGDATADQLSLADLPGDIRVWADALDRGPCLPVDDAEHYRVRSEYWEARGHKGAAAELAEWDRGVDEAATAGELILWFEHDLFDQLALIRLLARLALRGMPEKLTIVSIDRHPEVPNFLGFGQLQPAHLAELWPRRTPLSKDAIDEAIATWIAFTARDPRALPFLMRRVKALPFLAGAIERHLEEFPDPTSGLSRSERQLLAAVARGVTGDRALIDAVQSIDPRYPMTDTLLRELMRDFTKLGLVSDNAITTIGRQTLAGAVDRVVELGIDTWRGGVQLTKSHAWRWDSAARRLTRP